MDSMLGKRWLVNGLLILVIGIAVLMGYQDRVQSPGEAKNSLTALKPADVTRLKIQLPGNNPVELRKSTELWFIESPFQWPAHNTTLKIITGIASSEFDSSIEVGNIDLAALGLRDPQVIVTLDDTRILFGTTNNIGERRYLMTGSKIYLLADVHLPFILQGIPGLIDRRLLPPSIPLKTINLGTERLTRDDAGNWQSSLASEIPVARLNQLVHQWQTLEAPSVKMFQPTGLPLRKIIAGLEDGSEIKFLLMSIYPELVIARPDLDVQYHFGEKQHQQLFEFVNEKP
jgi:hypothetical protein